MTKEGEEIEILKAYRDKLSNSASNQLDKDIKAFDAAIKALKQEPKIDVLDKIRAEIEVMDSNITEHGWRLIRKYDALQIIDKYKTESEETE